MSTGTDDATTMSHRGARLSHARAPGFWSTCSLADSLECTP